MKALFFLSIFVLLTGCYNAKMSTDEIITRRGWVMDIVGNPLDSVEISNFKNEILAYSNKNGYFEIKEEDYIFHQKIYFKKEYYILLFLISILKYGHFPFIDKSFSLLPFLNFTISN